MIEVKQNMCEDPGILCFQHCDKSKKVFCFQLPALCNVCAADIYNTELKIPPFRIPYPFRYAKEAPHTLVIKPTVGDFLHNYQNSLDLHIGITDSKGNVYEFDSDGIHIGNEKEWDECLPIIIKEKLDTTWKEYWDKTLWLLCQQDCWTSERYHKDKNNCYSFVLSFLRALACSELKPYLVDKTTFCAHFVVPRTRIAAKYISLFRQLTNNDFVVQF